MFGPLNLTPERLVEESLRFQQKLGAAAKSLQSLAAAEVGCTAKSEIYRDGKAVLYRFEGEKTPTRKTPLLICYALVNRPYMVDLQEDRSIVRSLLAAGHDVYLIDWGYPDRSDALMDLDDYINGVIDGCVDQLRTRCKVPAINLLGVCQGGAFSLCYASLHREKVANLVVMVTPVGFHPPDNMLSHWCRDLDVDAMVDSLGNVPGDLMNYCYLTLKPYRLNGQKYLGLVDMLDSPRDLENFLRMEKWIFDSPDQAGAAFRQFVKTFYQDNAFVEGGVEIGGSEVKLSELTMPVLNIYAEQDHLVPPAASKALARLVGTQDYTELSFKGGHIGIYVSGRAQREVPPAIDRWLSSRSD